MRRRRLLARLSVLCLALLLGALCACSAGKGTATDYGDFTVRTERAREAPETADVRTLPETTWSAESEQEDYVLNKSSGKFHYPSCSAVGEISEKNRWTYHGTREDVIEMGYQPCKICSP